MPIPHDFPCVNPLVPDTMPFLFSREVDRRRIEKAVVVAIDMGFEELKSWVNIFLFFVFAPLSPYLTFPTLVFCDLYRDV